MAKLFSLVPFCSISFHSWSVDAGLETGDARFLPSQERRWVFIVATHAGMVLDEGGYGAMGNCRDSDIKRRAGWMSGLGVAGMRCAVSDL